MVLDEITKMVSTIREWKQRALKEALGHSSDSSLERWVGTSGEGGEWIVNDISRVK